MFIRIIAILGACVALSACAVKNPQSGNVGYIGINESRVTDAVDRYDHNWRVAETNPTIVIAPRELGRGGLVNAPVPWLVCYQHLTMGATVHLCLDRDQWEHPLKPTHYVFYLNTQRGRTIDIPRYFEEYSNRAQYGRGTERTHISGRCTISLTRTHCQRTTTTVEVVTEDRYQRSRYKGDRHGDFRRQRVPDNFCGKYRDEWRTNCPRR